YVARGDAKLFNQASKVVMVRDGDRTVITMVNDFQGDVEDFAMVIPAPAVLARDQIRTVSAALVEHLDAYTAPRLVEYFDGDPCAETIINLSAARETAAASAGPARAKALGVTIEASYDVAEYDILILSATQSDGLATWLNENGYRMPAGAGPVLASYIDAGMKFFVAKVDLEEHGKSGSAFLSPLQLSFTSKDFMLPIRLGMLNAAGTQDLLLWTLTRRGRVETANYPTVPIPTGQTIPTYVKEDFGPAYKAVFGQSVKREGGAAVMMEYAWDMAWCDPCAADPLPNPALRELGVFWVDPGSAGYRIAAAREGETVAALARRLGLAANPLADFNNLRPGKRLSRGAWIRIPPGLDVPEDLVTIVPDPRRAPDVYVTRLHARYDAERFPEDLMLRVTDNRESFQGRYVMRHRWKGRAQCPAAEEYVKSLPDRFEREAQTLAKLTGWKVDEIRDDMRRAGTPAGESQSWWEKILED
ncbi:MAG: DUF2330 domain-containing protein, partial [Pseudomonadota bacterium]